MTITAPTPVKVIASEMYVCVDPVNNNNRFWQYERLNTPVSEPGKKGVMETGDLRITWGRVGDVGESQLKMWDEKWLLSKLREKSKATKERQAYSKVTTVGAPEPAKSSLVVSGTKVTSAAVAKAAVDEIAGGCAITAALVKKLAETNKHELVAATGGLAKGGMDIDLETGLVRTALGVVTLGAVKEARSVLDRMLPFVTKHDTESMKYTDLLGAYLRLVPQDVGTRKRGWHTDFINITAQTSLLDQLETSVELAEQRMVDAVNKVNGEAPTPVKKAMFECKLRLLKTESPTDSSVWSRIKKEFFATVNDRHTSSSLKPVRMYEVTIPHMVEAFEKQGRKVGNIKELWHGTRTFNLLSLLSRGFLLPNQLSTAQITGAMYGPGCYFSNQSSKSLNYSQNFWGGGARENNCYMFRVDVAMGREYIPTRAGDGRRPGYDSCWAKAGYSGVLNDEQIVYQTHQINPRYLIEFDK